MCKATEAACEPTKFIYFSREDRPKRPVGGAFGLSAWSADDGVDTWLCYTKECVMQRKGFTPDSYQDPTAQTSKHAPFLFEPRL